MWKKCIDLKNRKGSYLVEAAMIIPIFLLSVVMLMSAVPAMSTSEDVTFSVADEMRYESLKMTVFRNKYMFQARISGRICREHRENGKIQLRRCRYGYPKNGIKDLITITYQLQQKGADLFSLFASASWEETVTARAFTGTRHVTAPMSGFPEDDEMVCVFPEWGMRFHSASCTYVKGTCQMVYLTQKTKKGYQPCKLCGAKSAQIGSPVFCFTKYGKVYHLTGCKTMERYYVTMKKSKAVGQGYTPCLKCGG